MREIQYNRQKVLDYAKKWAFSRNPKYYNFDPVGGDCTNFISQCIFAGSNTMNYTKNTGWYYINGNNKSVGPYGKKVNQKEIQLGDIAQLSFNGQKFEHTLIIVNIENYFSLAGIKIASHTYDNYNKPISEYSFQKIRFVHIEGVRKY